MTSKLKHKQNGEKKKMASNKTKQNKNGVKTKQNGEEIYHKNTKIVNFHDLENICHTIKFFSKNFKIFF